MLSFDLLPALLAEQPGSFMCYCSNTGVEQKTISTFSPTSSLCVCVCVCVCVSMDGMNFKQGII